MDPSDPRHGGHPSQSIPDAAYPDDTPYQPGMGPRNDNLQNSINLPQVIIPPAATPSSAFQPQYTPPGSSFGNSIPLYSSTGHSPSSHTAPSPWTSTTSTTLHPQNIPQSPPPPYNPTQPPAAYSPLENIVSHPPLTDPRLQPTPPGSSHYSPSPYQAPSPYPPQSPYQSPSPYPPSPNPYGSAGSSINGPQKLGPIAEARLRRKRKVQMCIVALALAGLFFIALIVGVAVGVLKSKIKDDDEKIE